MVPFISQRYIFNWAMVAEFILGESRSSLATGYLKIVMKQFVALSSRGGGIFSLLSKQFV